MTLFSFGNNVLAGLMPISLVAPSWPGVVAPGPSDTASASDETVASGICGVAGGSVGISKDVTDGFMVDGSVGRTFEVLVTLCIPVGIVDVSTGRLLGLWEPVIRTKEGSVVVVEGVASGVVVGAFVVVVVVGGGVVGGGVDGGGVVGGEVVVGGVVVAGCVVVGFAVVVGGVVVMTGVVVVSTVVVTGGVVVGAVVVATVVVAAGAVVERGVVVAFGVDFGVVCCMGSAAVIPSAVAVLELLFGVVVPIGGGVVFWDVRGTHVPSTHLLL